MPRPGDHPMLTLPPETEQLARLLAARGGTTPEAIVREAVEAKAREAGVAAPTQPPPKRKRTFAEMKAISLRSAARPIIDARSPDEIIGYDEWGLPQ